MVNPGGIPGIQLSMTETRITEHSGPLPPPEVLADYERQLPGLAERIVRIAEIPVEMARDQHVHRMTLESKVIRSDVTKSWVGLVLGWTLAVLIVVLGFILIANDKSGQGLAAILATVGTIAGVFVYSERRRRAMVQDQGGI